MTTLKFNQDELARIGRGRELEAYVAALGEEVAARAKARAEKLFVDRGGGGIDSIASRIERDDKGVYARIGPDAAHWYMWLHEVGTVRERPRPFMRPALFGTRKATGGKESAIRGIRQDRRAAARTRVNRAAAKARRQAARSGG